MRKLLITSGIVVLLSLGWTAHANDDDTCLDTGDRGAAEDNCLVQQGCHYPTDAECNADPECAQNNRNPFNFYDSNVTRSEWFKSPCDSGINPSDCCNPESVPPPCTDTVTVGPYSDECRNGTWSPWDWNTHRRTYTGERCRTITTTSSCGGVTTREECIPCSFEQEDKNPPRCLATFEHADRWHRGEDFQTDPPLRCWLSVCSDEPGEKLPIVAPNPPGGGGAGGDDQCDEVEAYPIVEARHTSVVNFPANPDWADATPYSDQMLAELQDGDNTNGIVQYEDFKNCYMFDLGSDVTVDGVKLFANPNSCNGFSSDCGTSGMIWWGYSSTGTDWEVAPVSVFDDEFPGYLYVGGYGEPDFFQEDVDQPFTTPVAARYWMTCWNQGSTPDDYLSDVMIYSSDDSACDEVVVHGGAVSGCLPIPMLGDTPINFDDPNDSAPQIQVVIDELEPFHGSSCKIQVCDRAGNCGMCESPPLKYDDSEICQHSLGKSADGVSCGECDVDDDDCHCIKGDTSRCRDNGPVNCYTNPFHDRCPGFQNPVCLIDPFTPGCPVVNPCYPLVLPGAVCPVDSARFCARNPYHYGCNMICGIDGLAFKCSPEAPPEVVPGD